MADFMVRMSDDEAEEMLRIMASEDQRTIGTTNAIIIRQEWVRRHGANKLVEKRDEQQPQPEQG